MNKKKYFWDSIKDQHCFTIHNSDLVKIASLEWKGIFYPHYPFARLTKHSVEKNNRRMLRIGRGYYQGLKRAVAYAYVMNRDIEAYDYLSSPINKPMEAVDTRILTGDLDPELYLSLLKSGWTAETKPNAAYLL